MSCSFFTHSSSTHRPKTRQSARPCRMVNKRYRNNFECRNWFDVPFFTFLFLNTQHTQEMCVQLSRWFIGLFLLFSAHQSLVSLLWRLYGFLTFTLLLHSMRGKWFNLHPLKTIVHLISFSSSFFSADSSLHFTFFLLQISLLRYCFKSTSCISCCVCVSRMKAFIVGFQASSHPSHVLVRSRSLFNMRRAKCKFCKF